MIMAEVGAFYALKDDNQVDLSLSKLPVLPGLNVFGRTDSPVFTKEVSRKHVSIRVPASGVISASGLIEITVEGPNAIVLVSGGVRRKLCTAQKSELRGGDVVEFIPRAFPFRFISACPPCCGGEEDSVIVEGNEKKSEGRIAVSESHMMENSPGNSPARSTQIENDEALARMLQAQEDADAGEDDLSAEEEYEDWALEDVLSPAQREQIEADEAMAKRLQEEEDLRTGIVEGIVQGTVEGIVEGIVEGQLRTGVVEGFVQGGQDLAIILRGEEDLPGRGPDDSGVEEARPTDMEIFSSLQEQQRASANAANLTLMAMGRMVAAGNRGAAISSAGMDASQQGRDGAANTAVGIQGPVIVNSPQKLEEVTSQLQEERERVVRIVRGKARMESDEQQDTERGSIESEFKRPRLGQQQDSKPCPFAFSLLRTRDLPPGANSGTVQLTDVVQGDISFALISNYMVDIPWLLEACPALRTIPRVVVVHGESGASFERLQSTKPNNWELFKPNLPISYGTHHSKAMLLVYPRGVRVVVHTANYIYIDFNNKTQALWMQDFPIKPADATGRTGASSSSPFENDLVEYLEALRWPGVTAPLPVLGPTPINANFFRTFDFSLASVRLVASVPGYHHLDANRAPLWGHMKLRMVLQEETFAEEFWGSNLALQFSSIGSLDEKWIHSELATSLSAGSTAVSKRQLGLGKVQMVWPTVDDIRNSIEGYAAGNAVPSPEKNIKKEFLKRLWARWNAEHTGRQRAIPHMKSYVRYEGNSVAWFLLTSSNLSKAAWGTLQKNGSQLMIRSYELGVLFLPSLALKASTRWFSCTDPVLPRPVGILSPSPIANRPERGKLMISNDAGEGERSDTDEPIVRLPVPYSLPPQPYGPADVPWSWDRTYSEPDVFGELWPRPVRMYS